MFSNIFNSRSIKNKVVIQTTGVLVTALIFIIITMVILVKNQLREQTGILLGNQAKTLHEKIEQRINFLIENTVLLSTNGLMVNALTDSTERVKYLSPLVNNFMQGKDVVSLDVVDYGGVPIFQTQAHTLTYNNSVQLRTALALNQVTIYISEKDHQLVVISPIEYYSTTQGAVIVVFNMKTIVQRNLTMSKDIYVKLIKEKSSIFLHNFNPKITYTTYLHKANDNMPIFRKLNILLEIGIPETIFNAPIKNAVFKLILIGLLFIIISVFISTQMANNITKPILELYQRIKASSSGKEVLCSPLGSNDEVEDLAKAFDERTYMLQNQTKALQKKETELRTLVDAIPDLIWLKNSEGAYLSCNPTFERFFGAKEADIIGKTDYDFIEKELADFFRENDEKAMFSSKPHLNEEWLTFADGQYHGLFETVKTPVIDTNGTLIGVLGVARDITKRKQAEDDLRIAATAFESQEGMMVTDTNNIILRVNNAFKKITGYSAEEAVGKNPKILNSGRHKKEFYAAMWNSINKTGVWEGEIWNRRKNGETYPEHLTITAVKNTAGVLTNFVATLTDITQSKAATEKIENLAFYDPLTQLPNRRLLLDRLQQSLSESARNGQSGALLFLDLDHFKDLNDTLGHNIGDLLLQQVAQRLLSCVREGDTVARLGGDEFVVLLKDLSPEKFEAAAQTESIGEKVLASLNQLYILASYEYRNTPSIGATIFNNHKSEVEVLLKQADIAMYEAKASGRNALRFFDPAMQEAINTRLQLETELYQAIKQEQFQLYYQIQIDHNDQVLGAEALIRWVHPERGMISPFNFIPLAEETGLILPIGQWVLDNACAKLKTWEESELTQHLTLSVNVSAKQFNQVNFVDQIKTTLERHKINPKLLKLELTESMLANDINDMINKMDVLSKLGIGFSLDDFGTGYSSLQYLKRLPLSQLKIDQSFVRDITTDESDKAIILTITTMAYSLGLSVIAEGVETLEQRAFLLNSGCMHYQGYLFGKPVPIDEFDDLLRKKG